jgi:glucokinase
MEMTMPQTAQEPVVAGIDIGGTKITVGLVGGNGTVIVREDTPIHVERGPSAATSRIREILCRQTQDAGLNIAGIGIGCTGPVDPFTGELGDVNTLPGWQGWNPVLQISADLGVSVAMENDADAATLGELRWGARNGKRSMVLVTVGTGIGAGIVLNGSLYRGAKGSHPEIGHHIVEPDGPWCTCGARGCWESLASGPAMEAWYAAQHRDAPSLNAKEICALARAGDAHARSAVEREAKYLGIGLANVISIFMPDSIALGGSIMQAADLLLDGVRTQVRQNCLLVPHELCEISVAMLGADTGLVGAAQVWHHRYRSLLRNRCD